MIYLYQKSICYKKLDIYLNRKIDIHRICIKKYKTQVFRELILTLNLFRSDNLNYLHGGRSQVVRQWIVTPPFAGSNPVVRLYNKERL